MLDLYNRDVLLKVMCFNYRIMVASVPLLQFALPRAEDATRLYYAKHIDEESGHDEMLRADIAAMGVVHVPWLHNAAQLAGAQYYFIAHHHPAMLLGYMNAFEKDSLPLSEVDKLEAHHGVKLSSMRHHATHDPAHKDDIGALIDSLDEDLRALVRWNESNVSHFIGEVFNG